MKVQLFVCDNCNKKESSIDTGNRDFYRKWLFVKNGAMIDHFHFCCVDCVVEHIKSHDIVPSDSCRFKTENLGKN